MLYDLVVCLGAFVSLALGSGLLALIDRLITPAIEIITLIIGRKIGGKLGGRMVKNVYNRLDCESNRELLIQVCRSKRGEK